MRQSRPVAHGCPLFHSRLGEPAGVIATSRNAVPDGIVPDGLQNPNIFLDSPGRFAIVQADCVPFLVMVAQGSLETG